MNACYTICMAIIPLPSKIEPLSGSFHLSPQTVILTDAANQWNAGYLRELLIRPTGFPLLILANDSVTSNGIRLGLDPELASLGPEGYRLTVAPAGVMIEASATAGVFYGIQSLRQLLPVTVEERRHVEQTDWDVPAQVITDQSRFPWRGFMLDEGRHFQGMETVLQTLDLLALQKLNVFHWHLTE